jgi:hypothetical protein
MKAGKMKFFKGPEHQTVERLLKQYRFPVTLLAKNCLLSQTLSKLGKEFLCHNPSLTLIHNFFKGLFTSESP